VTAQGDSISLGSVSKVALAMFLDGDVKALRAYHAGDRTGWKIYCLRGSLNKN
jgi:hypothetical protein